MSHVAVDRFDRLGNPGDRVPDLGMAETDEGLRMEDNYVDLTYDRVIRQTEKAVLLDFGDAERWIPLSQIDPEYLPLDETGGEVAVQFWFIRKEGLEDYES